jgi:hypothetical protein
MTDLYAKRPIRIPVRYVDGKWELLYGGPIPVAADATVNCTPSLDQPAGRFSSC